MGRPLNKKYFGNRNIGSASTTTDDGIGGSSVSSVTLNALGSYTTRPTVTFATPTLPGGVRATGTITSEALSAVVTEAGTGYEVGDLLTVTTAGGSAIAYVATVDTDGEVLTVNFTGTGADRGSFEALPSGAQVTTTDSEDGEDATLTITFRAKAVVITESGSGYVAAPVATFTQSVTATSVNMLVDSGGIRTVGNQENAIVAYAYRGDALTLVDIVRQVSGSTGTIGDRYRVNNATTAADIDNDTTALQTSFIARLVTTTAASVITANGKEESEMNIVAIDSDGGTYLVRKLTARKAVLVPAAVTRLSSSAGTQFPLVDGKPKSVAWTFNGTAGTKVRNEQSYLIEGVNVQLENA